MDELAMSDIGAVQEYLLRYRATSGKCMDLQTIHPLGIFFYFVEFPPRVKVSELKLMYLICTTCLLLLTKYLLSYEQEIRRKMGNWERA